MLVEINFQRAVSQLVVVVVQCILFFSLSVSYKFVNRFIVLELEILNEVSSLNKELSLLNEVVTKVLLDFLL